jgi:hypothetical protein
MKLIELQRRADRSFGGLWDAIGLAPLRELQASALRLTDARIAECVALAECSRVAMLASVQGLGELAQVLAQRERKGEVVSSPLALLRLWLRSLDAATQEALLSDLGLAATSAVVRTGAQRRLAEQRLVSLGARAIGLPTRGEQDEAFHEIQGLKRRLRRLEAAARGEEEPT